MPYPVFPSRLWYADNRRSDANRAQGNRFTEGKLFIVVFCTDQHNVTARTSRGVNAGGHAIERSRAGAERRQAHIAARLSTESLSAASKIHRKQSVFLLQ